MSASESFGGSSGANGGSDFRAPKGPEALMPSPSVQEGAKGLQEAIDVTDDIEIDYMVSNYRKLCLIKKDLDSLSEEAHAPVFMRYKREILSSGMTMNEVFTRVMGENVAQYRERKVSEFIESGNWLIYAQKQQEWKEWVEARAEGEFFPDDVEATLVAMRSLDSFKDGFQTVNETLKRMAGKSYSYVRSAIFDFSKMGPAFMEVSARLNDECLSRKELIAIEEKKLKNAEMALDELGADVGEH